MRAAWAIACQELLLARRNLLVLIATLVMSIFSLVLAFVGTAPAGALGVDRLAATVASLTTLSVYLVPLIALLLSFDAVAGERDRGTLALTFAYPVGRPQFLLGKFAAHLFSLLVALVVGFTAVLALVFALGDTSPASLRALAVLLFTAIPLGAAFLGLGYILSALARQSGAAAGLVIGLWLIGIVLYDLGLLGALVADGGGVFTERVFPWLLAANPADAFRLVNLSGPESALLTSGLEATAGALRPWAAPLSLTLWPVAALLGAWASLRRIEP